MVPQDEGMVPQGWGRLVQAEGAASVKALRAESCS